MEYFGQNSVIRDALKTYTRKRYTHRYIIHMYIVRIIVEVAENEVFIE